MIAAPGALATAPLSAAPPASGALPTAAVVARGVSPRATAEGSQRKLLVDRRGWLLLAYVRPVAGVDQIFLAESPDRGRTWTHTQVTAGSRLARLPSLAAGEDGTIHLVWTEYTPVGRVLYRARRAGRWGPPLPLSPPGAYAGVPVVGVAGGTVHVLWYGIRAGQPPAPRRHGSLYEILATRLEEGRWTTPEVISPGLPDSINASLAVGGGEVPHAAWYQFDGRVYQVRYARFEAKWSPPRFLTTVGAEHTAVAIGAAGAQVHLVWIEQGNARRVMYRTLVAAPLAVFATAGQPLSGPAPVSDPVIDASGLWVIAAWRAGEQIVLRQIRPVGSPQILGEGGGPALAVAGQTAYVAWTKTEGERADLLIMALPLR